MTIKNTVESACQLAYSLSDQSYPLPFTASQILPNGALETQVLVDPGHVSIHPRLFIAIMDKAEENGPKATSGTLNYCLFTHRGTYKDVMYADQADQNAGILTETFLYRTKTFGRVKNSNNHVQRIGLFLGKSSVTYDLQP